MTALPLVIILRSTPLTVILRSAPLTVILRSIPPHCHSEEHTPSLSF